MSTNVISPRERPPLTPLTLAAIVFCAASAGMGASVDLKRQQVRGRPLLVVTNNYYEAVLEPAKGGQITRLRHIAGSGLTLSMGADFDARLGPPGLAESAYDYEVVEDSRQRVVVACWQRPASAAQNGELWQKTFIFQADSPAIQVFADIVPLDRARHVAYGVRNKVTLASSSGHAVVCFVSGADNAKTIDCAKVPAEWEEWVRPGGECVAGVLDKTSGEGLAMVVGQPDPKYVYLRRSRSAPGVTLDLSFPIKAAPVGKRHRVRWSVLPMVGVRTVEDVFKRIATIKLNDAEPDFRPPMMSSVALQTQAHKGSVRKVLVASAPDRRGLYGFRQAFKALPFPIEVTDVACVRGTYWPGENDFLRRLPASAAEWAAYTAAIFVDVPGWAFTKGDGHRLRKFVNAGGIVIFLGDQGRGYRDTVVSSLIPLQIPYAKAAAKDSDGRQYLNDKSPWTPLTFQGFKHPILRGLPRNELPKTVVHQAAHKGSAELLMAAGPYPALLLKPLGKGCVASMPISLSPQAETDPAAPPDLAAKQDSLEGTLTQWPFYDDLWRRILTRLTNPPPPVFFSGLSVPNEPRITLPAKLAFEYELGNVSDSKAQAQVHIDFWRDGQPLKDCHALTKFDLDPNKYVGQQTSIELPQGHGHYRYAVSLTDAKGHTIDWIDGEFLGVPKTFLDVDIGPIRCFAFGSDMPVRVFIRGIKAKRLKVRSAVADSSGKTVLLLPDVELKDLSLAKMVIDCGPARLRLPPGRYELRATLLGGDKLGRTLDQVSDTFTVAPRPDCQPFPIVLGGLCVSDPATTKADAHQALALGANAIHLAENRLSTPNFGSVRGQRIVEMVRCAAANGLGLVGSPPDLACALNRFCPAQIAANGLPKAPLDALRDYLQARTPTGLYLAFSVVPPTAPRLHPPCDICHKTFRTKFGYDMPQDAASPRYYYTRRFMSDSAAAVAGKCCAALANANVQGFPIAIIEPETYFLGAYDPVSFCHSFRAVALRTAVSPSRHRLWLDVMRGALPDGKAALWGCVNVSPRGGRSWTADQARHQMYQALGRGARGLYLWASDAGLEAFGDDAAFLDNVSKALKTEIARVGPLFQALTPRPGTVAMLYPWATFALGGDKTIVDDLAAARDALQSVAGPVAVLHENAIVAESPLDQYHLIVLVRSDCLPDRLGETLMKWIEGGGTLLALGRVGTRNEQQRASRFCERVLGVTFGPTVSSTVSNLTTRPAHGIVLNPVDARVLDTYRAGGAAFAEKKLGKGWALTLGFVPGVEDLRRILKRDPSPDMASADAPSLDVFTLTDGSDAADYVVAVSRAPKATTARVLLPANCGYAYAFDLVAGKALTIHKDEKGRRFLHLKFKPQAGRVVGLFKTKPAEIRVEFQAKGRQIRYTAQVVDSAGKPIAYALPIEVDVIDPAGRVRPEYGGVANGKLERECKLTSLDAKGAWRVSARVRSIKLAKQAVAQVD